jgi:hypothetical protein
MKNVRIIAAALVVSLVGPASFAFGQTAPATPPEAQPSAPATVPTPTPDVVPTMVPPTPSLTTEALGKIIFFRPSRLTGAVYTYHVVKVEADGDSTKESPRVCSLPNGRYCVYEAPAGIYNFNIRGPMAVNLDQDRIRLEIEPGQTYYIEQTVRIGLITGGFRLTPSTQQEFERRSPREWKPEEK